MTKPSQPSASPYTDMRSAIEAVYHRRRWFLAGLSIISVAVLALIYTELMQGKSMPITIIAGIVTWVLLACFVLINVLLRAIPSPK